ncbi:MAG TPA: hypothetical protein VLB44_07560, partial [Kofleriaceae bacterium]|nr:hypothetical protein [Kofleriaceae bacterium]
MRRIPLLIALLLPATASAHFHLDAPDAEWAQSTLGDPQKDFPCGPGAVSGAGTATNAVTTVMSGSTLTVTITETITHPGHYRVAIAQDEGG